MAVLKMTYYEIGHLQVAIYDAGFLEYQYYIRDWSDPNDYFKYVFSIEELWGEDELVEREDYLWELQNQFYG